MPTAGDDSCSMAPSPSAGCVAGGRRSRGGWVLAASPSADETGAARTVLRRRPANCQQLSPRSGIATAAPPGIVLAGPWSPRHAAAWTCSEVQGLESPPQSPVPHSAPSARASPALQRPPGPRGPGNAGRHSPDVDSARAPRRGAERACCASAAAACLASTLDAPAAVVVIVVMVSVSTCAGRSSDGPGRRHRKRDGPKNRVPPCLVSAASAAASTSRAATAPSTSHRASVVSALLVPHTVVHCVVRTGAVSKPSSRGPVVSHTKPVIRLTMSPNRRANTTPHVRRVKSNHVRRVILSRTRPRGERDAQGVHDVLDAGADAAGRGAPPTAHLRSASSAAGSVRGPPARGLRRRPRLLHPAHALANHLA